MALQKQLDLALNNLTREDPSLRVSHDNESGQTILSGMGELHLEVILERIRSEYKVSFKILVKDEVETKWNNFVLLIRFKLNFHQPKIGRLFPDRGGQYHTF